MKGRTSVDVLVGVLFVAVHAAPAGLVDQLLVAVISGLALAVAAPTLLYRSKP